MKLTVTIYSKRKKRDEKGSLGFLIEGRIHLTQEDIEQIAFDKWVNTHDTSEDRNYEAEFEEIVMS